MSKFLYQLPLSLLCSMLVLHPVVAKTSLPVPVKTLPIPENTDSRVLDAAYQTYLANKEIDKAYDVAMQAVKKDPDDLIWRERLANAALWNNKARVAIEQWIYLATHKADNLEAIEKGIQIAQQLNAYDALITLYQLRLKHPMSESERKKYDLLLAISYAKSGEPEEAITLLKDKPVDQLTKEELETLITLYRNLYEIDDELAMINQYQNRFGLTIDLAVRKASIFSDRNQFEEAFDVLNAMQGAPDTTVVYWQQLGELAWKTQHLAVAAIAYEKLFSLKKYSPHELERLVILYERERPKRAFELAVLGWKKYKTDSFFQYAMNIGLVLNKADEVKLLMDVLTPQERKKFEATQAFRQAEIAYYLSKQDWSQVNKLYLSTMTQFPKDNTIKTDYLWFLIDREQIGLLKDRIQQWESLALNTSDFWDVYASAYIILKQDEKAELFYKKLIAKYPDNYRWYMGFSAAIGGGDLGGAQTKQGALSRAARLRAWQLLNQTLTTDKKFKTAEEVNNYAYLSMEFERPDFSNAWMRSLPLHDNRMLNSTLMDMLFFKEYSQMAHLLLAYYKQTPLTIESWVHLRAALIDGDTDEMAYQLQHHFKTLPERDRPIAAEQTGQPKLAQQLAYEGLENTPYDNNLYDIYQNLILKHPNKWQVSSGYRGFTGISGFEVGAQGQQLIGVHSAGIAKTQNWFPRITDTAQMTKSPSVVHYLSAGMIRYFQEGQLLATVGERHAFRTNPTALLELTYPVTHLISTYFELGLNQESTDSVPLRIVGMRDYLDARATIALSERDQLSLRLGDDLNYGEDRTYLGNALHAEIAIDHGYRFTYPDPHLIFSIAHHQNTPTSGATSSFMRQFVPAGATANTFYMSQSSTDFNLLLTLGMKYLDEYTHRWRPFASLGGSYNTQFGIGYSATGGMAGSLIGRDHLAFFTEYEKSTSDTGGEPTLYIGAKYTYYY